MKERFKQLKSFNWRLFAALCALALIPAVYQTVKTFIISSNNPSTAFDIIGQMEWFDLINETLQAFLIIPLYSILNKIFKNDKENFARHTFKTGLITFIIYTLFSIGVLIYGSILVQAMNPNEIDLATTNHYLQLETVAFMIGIIVSFVNVVFVVVGKDKNVYIFLAISTVLSIITDFAFIPNFGVYGIAISNIIVNTLLAVASFVMLYMQKLIKLCWFHKTDLPVLKEWGKVGVFSGIQQFIDNFIYAVMIGRMVNMVAEQGNYWIANNFVWGWLLIPITALSEVIRRDCKDGYTQLKQFNYYFIAAAVVTVWALTIPLWTPFFRYAENLSNASEIFIIVIKLAPFYIAYIGCAIIDNIFIGLGKTIYNAINSLVINIVYYGIFYILYLTNAITFTMDTIIMMFGFGMVVHFAVSLLLEKVFFKKYELKKKPKVASVIDGDKQLEEKQETQANELDNKTSDSEN
ncbi:MAG: MATE family efflux transporter [Clostridia bacterium]|nr:MATE family efflux transporter [Clostridia bacterium]